MYIHDWTLHQVSQPEKDLLKGQANASRLGLELIGDSQRARLVLLSRPFAPKLHQSASLPGSPGLFTALPVGFSRTGV
jgi:hypothetical protein